MSAALVAARIVRWPASGDVLLVLGLAAGLRLAFLFRAPPFYVGGDSPTYLLPAVDLLTGNGFDPIAKRPPGYPLFLAACLALFGWDLQGVAFAQHLLGTATAVIAYALGRLTFGRPAGLLAGLLTALNGPLLIYEHYIMAEPLFTALLSAALLALTWAAQRPAAWRLLLAGLLFGLAAATRQTAQWMGVLVPLALLMGGAGWQTTARGTAVATSGFLLITLPLLAFDLARNGALSAGTFGETLVWRLSRSDSTEEFFKFKPRAVDDPTLQEARKFAVGQAADRELPSDTKVAIQQRFGLDEAQADAVLRTLAFEAILNRPTAYFTSSSEILLEHLTGTEQWLGGQGKAGGVTRYFDAERQYRAYWHPSLSSLVQNATPGMEREFRRAQWLGSLFQPYRLGPLLVGLFLVGLLAASLAPGARQGLVVAAAGLGLVTLAAFLAGSLPRYRYPADPFLAVVQMGGLVWLLSSARILLVRMQRRPRARSAPARAHEPTPATAPRNL